jgi:hypothetical protein
MTAIEVSGPTEHEHHHQEEERVATVTDPVCGMTIDSPTAAAHEEYEGAT